MHLGERSVKRSQFLGPDMNSSLTNTGYFVESKATGRRFFTDDIVIPEVQQPSVEEQVLYLPERPAAVPLRRQRAKARTPAISMLDIEGERVITQRFPEMFESNPSWWTLATAGLWRLINNHLHQVRHGCLKIRRRIG